MKYNKYTPMLVVIMALISFACLSLGVSYSFVMRTKVSGNTLLVTTGNLTSTVSFTNLDYIVSSLNDVDGMAIEDYGIINISKDNVYSVFYTMDIGYAIDSLPDGAELDSLIPMEYIRVALFPMSGSTVGSTPAVGPVSIADLVVNSVDADNVYKDTYFLNYGTFGTGSESAKYALKVWLDEDTPMSYDGGLVYLGVTVDQETLVSKSLYNISGTVVNSSGTVLSGAEVQFHNGKVTSTTSSTGTYTLSNVPDGTYNLSVTYNDVVYKSSIHIKSGTAVGLESTGTGSGVIGTYLQNSAYTYYTSPGAILAANTLATNSNQATATTYTIPNAYVLTGLESLSVLSINNLKIMLNSDKTLGITIAS